MNKPYAIDVIFRIIYHLQPMHYLLLFVCLVQFTTATLLLITAFFSFSVGLLFQEALTPPSGGIALLEEHISRRRLSMETGPDYAKSIQVSPDLELQLNKLIGFIVRDFIRGLWYDEKLNHSKSDEFPDAVAASLKEVFLTLGESFSQVNRTDLILQITRIATVHVREFRDFDLTQLDIKDYLALHPSSKFHRFYSRKQIIDHLRDLSMKLCVHLLPRSDRASAAVFGITREILATTVLLPIMEKITNPDWINSILLNLLRYKESSSNERSLVVQKDNVKKYLDRSLRLDQIISARKENLKECDDQLADNSTCDAREILEKKLSIQAELEELYDMKSEETAIPTPLITLLDIFKCAVFAKPIVKDAFSSTIQVELEINTLDGDSWKCTKSQSDFQDLGFKLDKKTFNSKMPTIQGGSTFSRYGQKELDEYAMSLTVWLNRLLKNEPASLFLPFVRFLQPPGNEATTQQEQSIVGSMWKSASSGDLRNFQKALNSTATTLLKSSSDAVLSLNANPMFYDKEPESRIQSSSISQEDLDIILDVVFAATEELFSIADGEKWLTQQSLHLIKVFLKKTFNTRLSNLIATKIDSVSSEKSVTDTISKACDTLWPDGQIWGSNPPPIRNQHDIDRTKHQLYCVITGDEGAKKDQEFEKVYNNLQTILGGDTAQKGIIRGFFLFQNQNLNIGLLCEILEVLVNLVTSF